MLANIASLGKQSVVIPSTTVMSTDISKSIQNQTFQMVRPQVSKRTFLGIPVISMTIAFGAGAYIGTNYKWAQPRKHLVRYQQSGNRLTDIKVSTQGLVLPWQKYRFVNFDPRNYDFDWILQYDRPEQLEISVKMQIGPCTSDYHVSAFMGFLDEIEYKEGAPEVMDAAVKDQIITAMKKYLESVEFDDAVDHLEETKKKLVEVIRKELDKKGLHVFGPSQHSFQISSLTDTFTQAVKSFSSFSKIPNLSNMKDIGNINWQSMMKLGQKLPKMTESFGKESQMIEIRVSGPRSLGRGKKFRS